MSIYEGLNEPQKTGVLTTEGPVLILAGAGSGKTRVLTHRIAYMIEEKDINPYNILAITFTNKAAAEMRERVDRLVGLGADSVWIMTFHATCVRILRRYIDRIGFSTNFSIYDSDDQKSVMKNVLKRLDVDTKTYKEKWFITKISNAKDEMISPDEMELNAADYQTRLCAKVYREYQKTLKESNALDFDDILSKTVELFRTDKEVLEYYQNRFRYIMVDEYQDTNTVQFKFISLLANAGNHNLCVVGDDDQSIYKFRGANIMNILNFEKVFPECKVIKLEQNYRSTQNILNAANAVIRNNDSRKEKSLWSDKGDGDKVSLKIYENAFEEAYGIAADIQKKVRDGFNYNDCAILYRTNAQSRNLEEKMIELNVPYRIYGGQNFYQRREIKDILSYLKTIDNARDELSVRRIINVPKRGIGATSVDKVAVFAMNNDMSLYDALTNVSYTGAVSAAAAKKIDGFVSLISLFRSEANEMSLKDFLAHIVSEINYEDYLSDEADTPEEVEDRMGNIAELISKAAVYEESTENPTLSGFLEEVALVADIDNMDDNNNIVSLMTLHSAKGLEFPVVYLAGMEDGLFPSYMSITSEDRTDLEEERRLCYVGITRAQKYLTLSMAKQRMVRGETQYNKISRFIKEIPMELIAEAGAGIKKPAPFLTGTPGAYKQTFASKTAFGSAPGTSAKPSPTRVDSYAETKTQPLGTLGYGIGDRVHHVKFGDGTVLNIANGGRDYEVTVDFGSTGTKKMFASFAKLVKIN